MSNNNENMEKSKSNNNDEDSSSQWIDFNNMANLDISPKSSFNPPTSLFNKKYKKFYIHHIT